MEITVDWGHIKTEKEFYNELLSQLMAPPWHGQNLDALADSLVTGDVNGVEPPFTIRNKNSFKVEAALSKFQGRVFDIFSEAVNANREILIIIE